MKKIFKILCITLAIFFVGATTAMAEYVPPKPVGFVNDFATVISPENTDLLTSSIKALNRATGDEIAVVTLPTLKGYPIEDVGLSIGRHWQVGQKGKDNGLVVLVAPNERKMRIEVGYGLEGTINDAKAGEIRDKYMIPFFKKGDYNTGIVNGTMALVQIIAKANNVNISSNYVPVKQQSKDSSLPFYDILYLYLFIFVFGISLLVQIVAFIKSIPQYGFKEAYIRTFYRRNNYGYIVGGGGFGGFDGGGGFGGFSGGGFGGGGCSGGW